MGVSNQLILQTMTLVVWTDPLPAYNKSSKDVTVSGLTVAYSTYYEELINH